METRQEHWNKIYATKAPNEVSWTEAEPSVSLELIRSLDLPKSARIMDCGGGESHLVDRLLEEGFSDITVLDVSAQAIEKTRQRLGTRGETVTLAASDVLDYLPNARFDLWHDRATFHFLTDPSDQEKYVDLVRRTVTGYLVIGTFSEQGPKRCSGLDVQQYSAESLVARFSPHFECLESRYSDHTTPFGTKQHFVFCLLKKI